MAKRKPRKVIKNYSFCKSVVYVIQAITGEKTHDILTTLVSEAEKVIEYNKIDTHEHLNSGWGQEKKARDYIYYPNTKLYLGIYIVLKAKRKTNNYNSPLINELSYTFKLPQSYIKMTENEYDDMAVDGMLTDSSFDIQAPKLKKTKPKKNKHQIDFSIMFF